jgi:hypothetical protein
MKKLILNAVILVIFLLSVNGKAQSPIDKVFEKYSGQDGFTTVNITKELIQMMMQVSPGETKDTNVHEIRKMMEQLNGLKILAFNFDSTNVVKAVAVYNEFSGQFPASTYKELMSVAEGRQNIRFLTKQDGAGKINEMVMLMKDRNEVAVLSLTGHIDLATVSKLSKGMNFKGMEGFSKLRNYKGKK